MSSYLFYCYFHGFHAFCWTYFSYFSSKLLSKNKITCHDDVNKPKFTIKKLCFAESTSRVGKLSHLQQGDGLWPSCQQVSTDTNVHKDIPLPNTFTTILINETSANIVFVCFFVFLLDLTPCSCEFQKNRLASIFDKLYSEWIVLPQKPEDPDISPISIPAASY